MSLEDLSLPPLQLYLTEQQVAELLNVTCACLQKWRERGVQLHQHQKFGDLVRYDRNDVIAYIKASRRPAPIQQAV